MSNEDKIVKDLEKVIEDMVIISNSITSLSEDIINKSPPDTITDDVVNVIDDSGEATKDINTLVSEIQQSPPNSKVDVIVNDIETIVNDSGELTKDIIKLVEDVHMDKNKEVVLEDIENIIEEGKKVLEDINTLTKDIKE